MKKLSFLLFAATVLFACNQPSPSSPAAASFQLDSVKAAIDANNATLIAALKSGDSASFVGCYTKDGCIMPGNSPKLCGAAGLAAFLKVNVQMGVADLKLVVTEVFGNSELVSEEGTYEIFGKDGSSLDKGKYIVTWKTENGKWKKYRDIFCTDLPPAPAPAAAKK